MNRISGAQLSSLILVSDAFTLLCLKGGISLITTAAFIAGILLQLAMAIPLMRHYSSGGMLKNAPRAVLWYYYIYILIWGGMLLVMVWNTSQELSVPSGNFPMVPEKLLLSGLIAVVCLYASSAGVRPLARASVIACALGALCIAAVIFGAIPRFDMENLRNTDASEGFFSDLSKGFVLSGGLGALVVYAGFTKTNPTKCITGYFIAKAVLYTAVTVTVSAVSGGIMSIADFPVITTAEISQPFSSQRIDSLFLIVFTILAVFAISAQAQAAAWLIGVLFPGFSSFRSTATLALMTGAGFLLPRTDLYSPLYVPAVTAVLFAVPLIMRKRRR